MQNFTNCNASVLNRYLNHFETMPKELMFSDLKEIASILRDADNLSEFSMKFGNLEISLTRAIQLSDAQGQRVEPAACSTDDTKPAKTMSSPFRVTEPVDRAPSVDAAPLAADTFALQSPMVGTFYRSPEPGAEPFVKVGSLVKKGDVICLIEVMKLINSIVAEEDGEIIEILVDNGGVVEFGQHLMVMRSR